MVEPLLVSLTSGSQPALAGHKVFIEFEACARSAISYLNGKQVSLYENSINAYGIDITDALQFGAKRERARRQSGQHDALPNAPSAPPTPEPRRYPLHSASGVERERQSPCRGHQPPRLAAPHRQDSSDASALRPRERGLHHASNFDIAKKTADVTVDAEVHSASRRSRHGRPLGSHRRPRRTGACAVRRRSRRHGGRRRSVSRPPET